MKILVINGPNLNMLGKRDQTLYGSKTLDEINASLVEQANELGMEIITYQSNHEGALIDFIQEHSSQANGIIINPGALTHYGLSLMDALIDAHLPIIEVHISDIHSREEFRKISVIEPISRHQISGEGWQGYTMALEVLARELSKGN
ncbi:MAG: type II 3-dehydroquinate dehydratase [Chloroflexi bacterium]|nr:type II 3-dehydroquinate dehydratase [Chloroflexota bacterium]